MKWTIAFVILSYINTTIAFEKDGKISIKNECMDGREQIAIYKDNTKIISYLCSEIQKCPKMDISRLTSEANVFHIHQYTPKPAKISTRKEKVALKSVRFALEESRLIPQPKRSSIVPSSLPLTSIATMISINPRRERVIRVFPRIKLRSFYVTFNSQCVITPTR